jgi:hypothetical protein
MVVLTFSADLCHAIFLFQLSISFSSCQGWDVLQSQVAAYINGDQVSIFHVP